MSEAGYRDAWETYKRALADLHGAAAFEEIAEPAIALAPPEPDAALDAADRCVEASARAEEELEELLNAREPAIRGQAARRMSALAGVDLHTATELARRESPLEALAVAAAEPSAPVAADALAELGAVLDQDLPPSEGLHPEAVAPPSGGPPSADEVAKLQTAVSNAFDTILKSASEQATDAVKGLASSAAVGVLADAVGKTLGGIIAGAPAGGGLLRRLRARAVDLLKSALRKLAKLLPASVSRFVEDQIEDWVKSGSLAADALSAIWDLPAQRARASTCIKEITDGDALAAAAKRVQDVVDAFSEQMKVVGWVTKILNAGGSWLARIAPPWSDIAVAGAYVAVAGYAVVGGGDYVDGAHSTNFVDGVVAVVCG